MLDRVSDQTFEQQVLLSPEPVLVNFFAPQRGTWLTMSPVLEQIATEMQGLVKVVRLDVSMNPTVRAQYDIHGLPTLILFNMGDMVARRVGALAQREELEAWIKRELHVG